MNNIFLPIDGLLWTFFIEFFIVSLTIISLIITNQYYTFSTFINVVMFLIIQAIISIIIMKIIELKFKFKPGIYSIKRYPHIYRAYLIYLYMYSTNLGLFWHLTFPGVITRPFLYSILGCRVKISTVAHVAKIHDPIFTKLGNNVFLGCDCNLIAHVVTLVKGEIALILGRITIEDNTLVGNNTLIMPGVKIGSNSLIQAGSYIPMSSQIPADEVWGGHPATKLGVNQNVTK